MENKMELYEDWEFNVLGIYNYRKPGKLDAYVRYIIEHHDHIEGDLCEAGVFKGRTLLAAGLLLRELGSGKQVYGFDSFHGFPDVHHQNDDLTRFEELLREGKISQEHYSKTQRNLRFRSMSVKAPLTSQNISLSSDFSSANIEEIQKKVDLLGLDNVHIVPGMFDVTMTEKQSQPSKIMAALLDCDLYPSYRVALPFMWARLAVGGYIWLDEYYSLKFPGARIATDEFFKNRDDKPRKHKMEAGDFERWYVEKLYDRSCHCS
jgi:hypothetical protein